MIPNLDDIGESTDDRAVSPVIGVILMVAITVILAAVIGTFVLDIGQDAGQTSAQASLQASVSTTTDNVTLQHRGGDALQAQQIQVVIANETGSGSMTWDVGADPDTFTVGETAEFDLDTGNVSNWGLSTSSGGPIDIVSGNQYTITVIDTNAERVVFETTITA